MVWIEIYETASESYCRLSDEEWWKVTLFVFSLQNVIRCLTTVREKKKLLCKYVVASQSILTQCRSNSEDLKKIKKMTPSKTGNYGPDF